MDIKYLRPVIALSAAATLLLAGCSSNTAEESPTSGDDVEATTLSMTSPGEDQPSGEPSDADTPSEETAMDDSPSSDATSDADSSTEDDSAADAESGPNADLLAAAKTALAELPDGVLTSIESENNDTQWEVKIIDSAGSKYELIVSRDGATMSDGPREQNISDNDKQKYLDHVSAAKLSYLDAVAALENHISDGMIDELELDTENGVLVWEADVYGSDGSKNELLVDAATGVVTIDD